jgi:F0F1-type ATP synthase delta subunit
MMATDPRALASALYLAVRDSDDRTAEERIRGFAATVAGRGLAPVLGEVLKALPDVAMELDGIERVDVTVARPLAKDALDALLTKAGIDPKQSDVHVAVDPDLVGGATVRTKHRLVNVSIRGKLDQLGRAR